MNLIYGKFIKRYKRFLVDVKTSDNQIITAHCTNSGSLKSCLVQDAPVVLSPVTNPNRKTKFTWEMIKIGDTWVGVNTMKANEIAYQLLIDKKLKDFEDLTVIKREVKFGNSRIDLYAENGRDKFFIEVKNVTYRHGDYALFPDAKTIRGQKHLIELMSAIDKGYKAAMFFIIQRTDTKIFAPAWNIDPQYATLLQQAHDKGVKIYPIQIKISPQGWQLNKILPFKLEKFNIQDI